MGEWVGGCEQQSQQHIDHTWLWETLTSSTKYSPCIFLPPGWTWCWTNSFCLKLNLARTGGRIKWPSSSKKGSVWLIDGWTSKSERYYFRSLYNSGITEDTGIILRKTDVDSHVRFANTVCLATEPCICHFWSLLQQFNVFRAETCSGGGSHCSY